MFEQDCTQKANIIKLIFRNLKSVILDLKSSLIVEIFYSRKKYCY